MKAGHTKTSILCHVAIIYMYRYIYTHIYTHTCACLYPLVFSTMLYLVIQFKNNRKKYEFYSVEPSVYIIGMTVLIVSLTGPRIPGREGSPWRIILIVFLGMGRPHTVGGIIPSTT